MRILYDSQIFDKQRFGGISRYFSEVIFDLEKNSDVNPNLPLIYTENFYFKANFYQNIFGLLKNKKFKGKDIIRSFFLNLNRKLSTKYLRKGNFDLFHPTYYEDYFLEYLGKKPFVLTIYDMIHEIYIGEYFSKSDVAFDNKKKLAVLSKRIIAISENTKKDIVKFLGVDKDKVEVVYLANSLDKKKYKKVALPQKFILFVGNRSGYKNFLRFIRAILNLLKGDRDLFVVCAGGEKFDTYELDFFVKNSIEDRVLHYSVYDEELLYIYQKALLFIFPSLYEGFGIPILESFNCCCPVACSKRSSFPEVALDAAIYFDPENEDEINGAVERILIDSDLRMNLIKKGFQRSKDFSWKKTSEKTKNVYLSIL